MQCTTSRRRQIELVHFDRGGLMHPTCSSPASGVPLRARCGAGFALGGGHGGHELAVEGPVAGDVGQVFPVADGQAGQIGRAQGRRFGDDGPADRGVENVGLELHQAVVHRRAAIDLEHGQRQAGVGPHRFEQVARLEGHRLDRRAGDVGGRRAAGDAEDRAAGIGIPVRSAQADERRHDDDAARVGHAARPAASTSADVLMMPSPSRSHCTTAPAMNTEPSRQYVVLPPICQPTVVSSLCFDSPRLLADVQQHEAAGAVGVLGAARLEAGLAERGRLLVARVAGDGNRPAEQRRDRVSP